MRTRSIVAQGLCTALIATGITLSVGGIITGRQVPLTDDVGIERTASSLLVQRNPISNASSQSVSVSKKFWPSGSAEAVVVEVRDTFAIATAGPLARFKGLPLLIVDRDAPADVKAELIRLKASNAILIGPAFSPKALLRSEINSVVASQSWTSAPGPDEQDSPVASMFPGPVDEIFLTDALDQVDLVTASSASAFQKSPLFTVGTSLSLWEKGELQRLKPKRALFVGSSTAVAQTVAAVEALGIPVLSISGDTAVARNETVVRSLQGRNFNSMSLFVGSTTASFEALAASFEASQESSIPQFAANPGSLSGYVKEQASSWGPEMKSATLIGPTTGLTDTYKSQLQASVASPRSVVPAFHVTGTSTNADGTGTIKLSAQPNAVRYTLTDLMGTKLYDGATPTYPVPADGTTFKAVAFNITGTKIAERDVRVAVNPDDVSHKTKLAATSDATTTNLNWSEGSVALRPRQITRHEMVRDAQGQLAVTGTVRIGSTCATSFTDASRPAGKEVIYEVSQYGTADKNICSSATSQTSVREAQIDLTALRVPASGSTAAAITQAAPVVDAPTPTTAERSLMDLHSRSAAQGVATESTSLPWTFRYQTFIPERLIRPVPWDSQVFDGNNRGFGAWIEPFKTRADVTFYFDSSRQISTMWFGKAVGVTTEYSCPGTTFNNCSYVKQAQASTDGIKWFDTRAVWSRRVARLESDVALPIRPHGVLWGLSPAPGISHTMDILYWPNGFSVSGVHDGAPAHELWGGWVPGEYIPIMTHDRQCDFGMGLAGFCSVSFNIKV